MITIKAQSGFSIVEIFVGFSVIAVGITIGIIGMNTYNTQNKTVPTAQVKPFTTQNIVTDVPIAPVINTVQSLDTASTTIDGINIDDDSGDNAKLESQTADF